MKKRYGVKRRVLRQLKREADYTCAYCGGKDGYTIDHIIPRSLGGSCGLENLIVACGPCNRRKWSHPLKGRTLKNGWKVRCLEVRVLNAPQKERVAAVFFLAATLSGCASPVGYYVPPEAPIYDREGMTALYEVVEGGGS